MKVLENRKNSPVKHLGWVEESGAMVKVWGVGQRGPHLAHSVELLDIALALMANDVMVGRRIPKEWRDKYQPDMVVVIGEKTFFWEHDRDTEDYDQYTSRMKKLADCPFDVLWTCPTDERIVELMDAAPNERHWFTTFEHAKTNPHDKIWENNAGVLAGLPAVQLGVQYVPTEVPLRVGE